MTPHIFCSNPKSFKVHRKSSLASKLRSSVSQKLLEFLNNYTDRVLIDYIIVLVCNGKDQYQARDDLQAFLGDRTAEFVAWLWDFLAEGGDHCSTEDKLEGGKKCRSRGINKSEFVSDDRSTTENAKIYYQSNTESDAVNRDGNNLAEGFDNCSDSEVPSNGMFSEKVVSLHGSNERENAKVYPVKKPNNEYLKHETPRKSVSSIVVASAEKRVSSDIEKVDRGKGNVVPGQLLLIDDKETVSRNLQPSIPEDPCIKEVILDHVSKSSFSPSSSSVMPSADQRPRISVWDRLGKPKPCEDMLIRENKQDDESVKVDANTEQMGYPNRSVSHFSNQKDLPNKIGTNSDLVGKRTLELGVGETSHPHISNNIRRKRHFSEDNDIPACISASVVSQTNSDILHKEASQHTKKLKSMSGDSMATSNVVTEVLDVKERLRQMEMEMAKLRSKQLEMKKDGKSNSSSHSGKKEHRMEDLDSRTVLVMNVHFAASRDALSLYFSQCGTVSNVVIVMDKASGRPKGSAYVTFSDGESVDKALALSGTTFFSRIIQISRKTEAAALASPLGQLPGRPSEVSSSYIKTPISARPHRLQWRREASGPSAPLASTSKANVVAVPSMQQQEFN